MQEILERLKKKYKDFAKNGWTPWEVMQFIWNVLKELVVTVEAFNESGDRKKMFVLMGLHELYYAFDPNLPIVFGRLERYIESWMLNTLASFLVDVIVENFNENGWPA